MHFSYQFGHFRRQLFKGFRHFGWLTLEADSLFRHSCGFNVFEYCMQRSGRSGARSLDNDRRSGAVRGFVFASTSQSPPSPLLVRSDVPSRPAARDAYFHCLVQRRASALPLRCSSTTTHPHGHPRGATISAAILSPRRSLLTAARGNVRGGGPPSPIRAARPQRHTRAAVRAGRLSPRPSPGPAMQNAVLALLPTPPRAGWQERVMHWVMLCARLYLQHAAKHTEKVFCWAQNF